MLGESSLQLDVAVRQLFEVNTVWPSLAWHKLNLVSLYLVGPAHRLPFLTPGFEHRRIQPIIRNIVHIAPVRQKPPVVLVEGPEGHRHTKIQSIEVAGSREHWRQEANPKARGGEAFRFHDHHSPSPSCLRTESTSERASSRLPDSGARFKYKPFRVETWN